MKILHVRRAARASWRRVHGERHVERPVRCARVRLRPLEREISVRDDVGARLKSTSCVAEARLDRVPRVRGSVPRAIRRKARPRCRSRRERVRAPRWSCRRRATSCPRRPSRGTRTSRARSTRRDRRSSRCRTSARGAARSRSTPTRRRRRGASQRPQVLDERGLVVVASMPSGVRRREHARDGVVERRRAPVVEVRRRRRDAVERRRVERARGARVRRRCPSCATSGNAACSRTCRRRGAAPCRRDRARRCRRRVGEARPAVAGRAARRLWKIASPRATSVGSVVGGIGQRDARG